ncbi:hypothetical protein HPB49_011215 [Dermacentor silvarum]|uniref:Uncharacterized protein n=1 Tax=Dermacentor silvarum TaxID=543639 RepID=A0ACB8CKI6_DERSI|nr:hypothetical protein HPB49_011215 [Dermacentor silvarum]
MGYNNYTAKFKLAVIEFVEENGNRAAAKHFSVNESHVRCQTRDFVSPNIVEKSFKKTGLSNALDGTEDDALWESGDNGRDDDSQSDLSTSDSDWTVHDRIWLVKIRANC